MILDSLPLWRRYAALNPRLARGFEFLEKFPSDPAVGRHEIDGDAVYALVQRYHTRPVEQMQFEAHRRYIDIQYLASGCEVIQWAPLASLAAATKPYDAVTDAALYATTPGMAPMQLQVGQFAILFPDDAHAPCCAWGDPAEVLKVVVKVEV
jgi:YhcH/YjgK/YiaL family protein